MKIKRLRTLSWAAAISMLAAVILSVASVGDVAMADIYGDSAHGDGSTGVNREGTTHAQGDCGHCHDVFDDSICGVNALMLFAVDNPTSHTDNFCFQCHKAEPDSVQDNMIANNDFGCTFGGGPAMFDSIYEAFNPSGSYASSHDLLTIHDYSNARDWGSWMSDDTNACLVCHDQHVSQKNFPVAFNLNEGVNTAIRRGDDVNDYPGNLWGDEPDAVSGRPELMSDWTSGYQAPYRVGGGYEPDGSLSEPTNGWGSNRPSFVKMCASTCHRKVNVPGVLEVNWLSSSSSTWPGDPSAHGKKSADGGSFGVLKAPYSEALRGTYVLDCTDCHEPHGSTNPTLLRTTVNGVSGLTTGARGSSSAGGYWLDFCEACHDIYNEEDPGSSNHPVVYPGARCGDYIGCHLRSDGDGGNHGYQF